jgi:hypothetical protein
MQEHPIPQAVTSYEFHLIGNMTLKQFLELGAGIITGVLIYQTNLPDIIKWPLIIFFVGLGGLIAFVPYEGRPMDQWFLALIRAIYKPTQFFWKKSENIPAYFTYTVMNSTSYVQELDLSPYKHKRIFEYIQTLPAEQQLNPLDMQEAQQISGIMGLFDSVQVERIEAVEQITKPNLTLTPHSLQSFDSLFDTNGQSIETAQIPSEPVVMYQNIPEVLPPIIETQVEEIPEPAVVDQTQSTIVDVFTNTVTPTTQAPEVTQDIQTSSSLPFPQKPSTPNIVVGMIFDQYGNIVENAIVEIEDIQGMPVRAVRTNSIGQFFISTPLRDGEYYLKVDKEGILFPTQKLVLSNTILDPVEIHATQSVN